MSRDEIVGYLERYAAERQLELLLETAVERIDRSDHLWRLETSRGPMFAHSVVVATGVNCVPRIPPWPGRDAPLRAPAEVQPQRLVEAVPQLLVVLFGPALAALSPFGVLVRYPGTWATLREAQQGMRTCRRFRALARRSLGLGP